MNHEQIEALASVLKDVPSLTEVEVRHAGATLRFRRGGTPVTLAPSEPLDVQPTPTQVVAAPPKTELVRAGFVGIFHALAGKPVGNGDSVKAKQVLGHIETMRLMNDCVSSIDGTIEQLLVQDGQPVEWGQALFEIARGAAR
jgi:acetyl-CoA carboxylase biotin carboxyl carrier protein